MTAYDIPSVANLAFYIDTDVGRHHFHVRAFRGLTYATVETDAGEVLVEGVRCMDGGWILPRWMTAGQGNYRFEDTNGNYPYYENFGVSCKLVRYEPGEAADGD